jgi:eukaryotic-like serine/threonine-protein kinase
LSSPAAGSTLCDGRYRLDEVLGRGGMAIVWGATDLQLERRVAIKIIADVLAVDPQFVARFEREARLAAGVNHPNVVKIFDYSTDEERPLLVMEYVPGGTLRDARDGVDPLALAEDLLDALAHIHGAGILHRDVKPANVLIGADGSPRLTDFGIARSEEQTGLTQTGQVMGTLRYIAPEVAAGGRATPQSDLYSLGVVVGEAAGENPPRALAGLLARMTAADPAQRPASADEALAELAPTRALPGTDEPPATARLGSAPRPASAARSASASRPASAPRPASPARSASGAPPIRRVRIRLDSRRLMMLAGLVGLIAVLIAISVGGGGGSGSQTTSTKSGSPSVPAPAPADAPLDAQLSQLEQIVRSAPQR